MSGTSDDLETGTIVFVESVVPELEDGDYEVVVAQHVRNTSTKGNQFDEAYVNRTRFRVEGPRYRLEPDAVRTVFPPPHSVGEFDGVLPHVVLERKTLPWERSANDPDGAGSRRAPWLALLVFHDSDSGSPTSDGGVPWQPQPALVSSLTGYPEAPRTSEATDPCQVIEVPAALWEQIAPGYEELRWLTHVRQIGATPNASSSESAPTGGELSVVLGNRLPHPNERNTVHLVSVEGLENRLPGGTHPVETSIRLASLKSWSFTSIDPRETFTGFLKALDVDSFRIRPSLPEQAMLEVGGVEGEAPRRLGVAADGGVVVGDEGDNWALVRLSDGTYHVKVAGGRADGRDLLSCPEDGSRVDLWMEDDDSGRQRWRFEPKADGSHVIRPSRGVTSTRTYLSGDSDGTSVYLATEDDGSGRQHWRVAGGSEPEPAVAFVDAALDMGYTALDHQTRQGVPTVSWYRGPLVPYATEPGTVVDIGSPITSADALVRYDDRVGMLDTTYAAAWQLGQLLGLQSATFSKALARWRHANTMRAALDLETSALNGLLGDSLAPTPQADGHVAALDEVSARVLAGCLPGIEPDASTADPPAFGSFTHAVGAGPADPAAALVDPGSWQGIQVPKVVTDWLGSLRVLAGVPFAYLVPDEALLPSESLRFFQIDTNWVDALVEGGFSIGRTSPAMETHDAVVHDQVHRRDDPPKVMSGFLLRSGVVAGWPGLQVAVRNQTGALLTVDRLVHLAPSMLLCLVHGDSTIGSVELSEPPEGLHFGVDEDARQKTPRRLVATADGGVGSEMTEKTVEVIFRPGDGTVFEIRMLVDQLDCATPAEFALQMIEGVQSVTFEVTQL